MGEQAKPQIASLTPPEITLYPEDPNTESSH
jgi:hypothetical protein